MDCAYKCILSAVDIRDVHVVSRRTDIFLLIASDKISIG